MNYRILQKLRLKRKKGRDCKSFPVGVETHIHPQQMPWYSGTTCQIFPKFDFLTVQTPLYTYLKEQYTTTQFSNQIKTITLVQFSSVTQLCLTLCDPMDRIPPGSSVHGDSPGRNAGVGCHALLQGIFPTQGSNPGLLHCRRILYRLNHQGSSFINLRLLKCL